MILYFGLHHGFGTPWKRERSMILNGIAQARCFSYFDLSLKSVETMRRFFIFLKMGEGAVKMKGENDLLVVRVFGMFGLCFVAAVSGWLHDIIENRAADYPYSCSGPLDWYTWIFLIIFCVILFSALCGCVGAIIRPQIYIKD